MSSRDIEWSLKEKKIARRAFDAALEETLAKTMAEFKRRANEAATPDEMWAVEDYLRQRRKEIDATFDCDRAFIVHLIVKYLETLEVALRIRSDTGVPFGRSPR